MPIAVLDSVHILSEFFDYYPRIRSRRLTMEHVMRELFVPMLYTSMTTAVGFASLALVPIPPVQVFGVFVALGVLLAWLLSISFIPAYIFLVRREKIEVLAGTRAQAGDVDTQSFGGALQKLRVFSLQHATRIVALSAVPPLDRVEGLGDDRERLQAQEVELHQADFFDVLHIELGDDTATAGLAEQRCEIG